MTAIKGSTVLVTGGGRGLGAAFVRELLEAGAAKVYATARDPKTVSNTGAIPIQLDVTDPASVAALAAQVQDVTILINNAGVATSLPFLTGDLEAIRAELETNYFGPLVVTRAVAPIIAANGGGHVLNVASVLSWLALGNSYSASKAALWSMTNSVRLELLPQHVGVTSLHVGYMDTDMAAHVDGPKADPVDVARQGLAAIEAGEFEVLADSLTKQVKAGLSGDVSALYPQLAGEASQVS